MYYIILWEIINSTPLKALNGLAPAYIKDLLKPYIPTRTLRSSTQNLLEVPSVILVTYGQRSFSLGGAHFHSIFTEVPHYQSLKPTLRLSFSNMLMGTSQSSI